MKVREPVARPLDVMAAELLLSAAQAYLVGVLLYIAVGVWGDLGVGGGSVAVILALLGVAVGGAWLYWLFGGVGWPMAAANVPAAMFLGFALVLGWAGNDLFRVEGAPLLTGLAAAIYGVVGGVFIDSPRRWRWDQRERPRAGTPVPRVSETTRTLATQVPRSLPRPSRAAAAGPIAPDSAVAPVGPPVPEASEPGPLPSAPWLDPLEAEGALDAPLPGAVPPDVPTPPAGTAAAEDEAEATPIELPTSIEPRAQRSPWAWAAPPEWNRDEDDEPPGGGSPRRR